MHQKIFLLQQQITELYGCLIFCKMFFCCEFSDTRKNREEEEEDGENRKMQTVLFFKQT